MKVNKRVRRAMQAAATVSRGSCLRLPFASRRRHIGQKSRRSKIRAVVCWRGQPDDANKQTIMFAFPDTRTSSVFFFSPCPCDFLQHPRLAYARRNGNGAFKLDRWPGTPNKENKRAGCKLFFSRFSITNFIFVFLVYLFFLR